MATSQHASEAATLEKYRVALQNVKTQPTIASLMAEFGYTPEVLATGEACYAAGNQAYLQNKTEADESSAAYQLFNQKKTALNDLYRMHRKKAKVAFRNDPVTAALLAVDGSQPGVYVKWMEMVKKLYAELAKSDSLKIQLARYKVTDAELVQADTLIAETEAARAAYLREAGESEDATKLKDAALAKLDEWMSEFYAVAKIALDEHPQLLESLGLSVRS